MEKGPEVEPYTPESWQTGAGASQFGDVVTTPPLFPRPLGANIPPGRQASR